MGNIVHLKDNMEYMPARRDDYFDLAVVDPPYYKGPEKLGYYGERQSKTGVFRGEFSKCGVWEVPDNNYYDELIRISKHQIIWGINYFSFAGKVSGRIIWDKCNPKTTFSDCEIASCSIFDSVRKFTFMWNGMMQGKGIVNGNIQQGNKSKNEKRIHPTQKPIALYKWIFTNYAKPGWKIFDSHVGSGSSRIAAHELGFDFTGCELDPDYHAAQEKRYREYLARGEQLFDTDEIGESIYSQGEII